MPLKGIRPHTWKYSDPLEHEQHIAWHKARAQANFRGEGWELSLKEYQMIWGDQWYLKGRSPHSLSLVRIDRSLPWSFTNCILRERREYLRENRYNELYKKYGKIYESKN